MEIYNRSRRCGSAYRGRNRYTRAQVERLARKFGISYQGRTMDQICQSLASLPLSVDAPLSVAVPPLSVPVPPVTFPTLSTPAYGPFTYSQTSKWPYYSVRGRPCSTMGRQPSRLVRANVEALADYYGISNYRYKTMDTICQQLAAKGV